MRRMVIAEDIRPLSEFRSSVTAFLKQVHDTKRPVVITQHGKGVAVLLDVAEYEEMAEKIELFGDIQLALKQVGNGEGVTHDQAKAEILRQVRK